MSIRNLLDGILSISMFMQQFIKIFHSVQEIGPFSLFQNLALGKASTDDKYHFSVLWARPFFNIKMSIRNLLGGILSISMFMQQFIKIFHSVQEIGPFSLFTEFELRQNLDQSKISFDNIMGYILSIYQCVCKISSQYATQFKR